MAQGRGSAEPAATVALSLAVLALLLRGLPTDAATHTVGDANGWTFSSGDWASGKSFRAGDVLAFNYVRLFHNVVVVDAASFRACSVPANAITYSSGSDRITLVRGANFFICSVPFHCQLGMKIAVTAT